MHGEQAILGSAGDVVHAEGSAVDAAPHRSDVRAWLFQPKREPGLVDIADLPRLVSRDENFVWIDLCDSSPDLLGTLAGLLDLDAAVLAGTLAPWRRPRLDVFADYFFVSATVPRLERESHQVHAGQLDLIVGRNFLISAHKLPLPFHDRVMARVRQNPEILRYDSDFMLYIMLDELLAYYELLNEHIEAEVEKLEERGLTETSEHFLVDLIHFKRYIFALRQLADQHRNVLAAFLRPDFHFISGPGVQTHFRDLDARLDHLLASLLTAREDVISAFDIYVSQMTHRTNQVVRVLTMVSAVLFSISVIVGVFGTNFHGVPLYSAPAFGVMIALIVAVAGLILLAFRRRGWI